MQAHAQVQLSTDFLCRVAPFAAAFKAIGVASGSAILAETQNAIVFDDDAPDVASNAIRAQRRQFGNGHKLGRPRRTNVRHFVKVDFSYKKGQSGNDAL